MATNPHREGQGEAGEGEEEIGMLTIRLANAVVLPMVLKSAIELGVVDVLSSSTGDSTSLSTTDLAGRIGADKNPEAPAVLDGMLRLLASYGVVKCSTRTKKGDGCGGGGGVERVYGRGPMCRFLAKDEDGGSAGPLFPLLLDKVFMRSWYHLNDAVLEGGIPFEREYGMTAFEYPATDQRFNQVFNQAMSNHTTLIMKKIIHVYRGFEGIKVLVDVGGGIGITLKIITSKHPDIKGVNFDLPHVISDAPSYPRVEHVGVDMFENVPRGDAIFMKWILHDWSDEHCLKLLKNCYEALPEDGKVIIVESILPAVPDGNVYSNIVFMQDLFMLVQNPGGKERTREGFEALAVKAGFSRFEVMCCAYNCWVMEFRKR